MRKLLKLLREYYESEMACRITWAVEVPQARSVEKECDVDAVYD